LDFSTLVSTSGISRRAADLVADDMFRKVADRFAQDGVITEKERGRLGHLSNALEMSSARADRIESESKSDRYRRAVSEAIADGTVTHEEAYLLNKLRSQLGVEDSAWTAGNLVS
jgi:tellurite resistance protein